MFLGGVGMEVKTRGLNRAGLLYVPAGSEARMDRGRGDRTGWCFVPEAWMSTSETRKAYKMSREKYTRCSVVMGVW